MKKYLLKLTPLLLLFLSACSAIVDGNMEPIISTYDGQFSLSYGFKASGRDGKERYAKLTSENNSMILNGWLSPESMANNCAVLFTRANPTFWEEKDFLEVEINNGKLNSYIFRKDYVEALSKDHQRTEAFMRELVNTLRANDLSRATAFMKTSEQLTEKDLRSFFQVLQSNLPKDYRETKLIGYSKSKDKENTHHISSVVISQDSTQRMILGTIVSDKDKLLFHEITF